VNQEGNFEIYLANFEQDFDKHIQELVSENVLSRIWSQDYTLWKPSPVEISNRLGWLNTPKLMKGKVSELSDFAQQIKEENFTTAVLLGMGGSSLAPEVFAKIFGTKDGYLNLHVLDSTDPGAVQEINEKYNLSETLFIVSTKSGGTVETLSFMKYFYNRILSELGNSQAGNHFIAITDPGSELEKVALKLNYRKIFLNDPDIGGRFSALSYFGLVPAALLGLDLESLLDRAVQEVEYDSAGQDRKSPAALLGLIIAKLALNNKDKLTFIMSDKIQSFGSWLEQLIAESTGKEGQGILPVVGEEILNVADYKSDRLFVIIHLKKDKHIKKLIKNFSISGHPTVVIRLDDIYDLGKEFFKWEMATAIAGWCLEINPFDQPDVESAKILARNMVNSYKESGVINTGDPSYLTKALQFFGDISGNNIPEIFEQLIGTVAGEKKSRGKYSYLALQAYLKPDLKTDKFLHQLRTLLQKKYQVATTLGYGPRFLHSTGQLHKGDAGNGIFIQVSADMPNDFDIPDEAGEDVSSISFGILKTAQYLGDFEALKEGNRKVIRIHLEKSVGDGLLHLIDELE
jgi:glucose-6-phosphate isomerase